MMLRALLLLFATLTAALGMESPRRIASYSPGATQTLLDLGLGGRIAAATRWCPLPKEHPARRTCDAFNPDLETLLQEKPDLVILPRLANPLWAERCLRAGLRVIVLQAEGADSAQQDIENIAAAVGEAAAARKLLQSVRAPGSTPKTLLIVWDGMMAGPDAYTQWALKRAGFASPLRKGTWIKFDWETLVQTQPDAILWIESSPTDGPIAPSEKHRKELSEVIAVKELNAIKTGKVYMVPSGGDWLPGTGLIRAAGKLREIRKDVP